MPLSNNAFRIQNQEEKDNVASQCVAHADALSKVQGS